MQPQNWLLVSHIHFLIVKISSYMSYKSACIFQAFLHSFSLKVFELMTFINQFALDSPIVLVDHDVSISC